MASWRSGYAEDCKSFYPGSIPGEASIFLPWRPLRGGWALAPLFMGACSRACLAQPGAAERMFQQREFHAHRATRGSISTRRRAAREKRSRIRRASNPSQISSAAASGSILIGLRKVFLVIGHRRADETMIDDLNGEALRPDKRGVKPRPYRSVPPLKNRKSPNPAGHCSRRAKR